MRTLKPGKTKVCAQCLDSFVPTKPMQKVCSPLCAAGYARAERERKSAGQAAPVLRLVPSSRAPAKKKPRNRAQRMEVAQKAFNAWVRERDYFEPCISCGCPTGVWNAGHYLTVGGNPALRFEPDNCHKQCVPCNTHKSGNVVRYRQHLLERIGVARVEWLEGPHPARHYSGDEIEALIRYYRAETRRLQSLREQGGAHGSEAEKAQG